MAKLGEAVARLVEVVGEVRVRQQRLENLVMALSARWGLVAEGTVREALYRVLQEYLGVARVEKWSVFDREGFVFGQPEYVEIDVAVKDDTHHLIEVKSSVDFYNVYVFNRKCELYMKTVKPVRVKRLLVTFFIDDRALEAARKAGIEVIRG